MKRKFDTIFNFIFETFILCSLLSAGVLGITIVIVMPVYGATILVASIGLTVISRISKKKES